MRYAAVPRSDGWVPEPKCDGIRAIAHVTEIDRRPLSQRCEGASDSATRRHTLRRTYISIALLANNFDVLWVMSQVGHADSKMTLDVYAQLQQRVKRDHGRAFDTLVRQAREQLYGTTTGLPERASDPVSGHESDHETTLGESDGSRDERIGEQKLSTCRRIPGWRDPGWSPGHHDFQVSLTGRAHQKSPGKRRISIDALRSVIVANSVNLPRILATRTVPWPELRPPHQLRRDGPAERAQAGRTPQAGSGPDGPVSTRPLLGCVVQRSSAPLRTQMRLGTAARAHAVS